MTEFRIHHTDEEIASAKQKLDAHITSAPSATAYIGGLEQSYRAIPRGASSLHRMLRVAKFIRQGDTRDTFWRATEAAYNGELLASNFLDYLRDEEATGGDLAHTYLQHRLTQSVPKGEKPEPPADQQARHFDVARHINNELMGLSLTPVEQYEAIADQYLAFIAPSEQFRAVARSGFRLVLLEAMQPSGADIEPTLAKVAHIPVSKKTVARPQPIEPTVTKQAMPVELQALESEFRGVEFNELFEDRSRFKKILTKHYKDMLQNFKELGMIGDATTVAIQRYCEIELNAFNLKEAFFQPDELLVATGNFYARALLAEQEHEEESDPLLVRFGDDYEIRGKFDRFTVIDAPTTQELANRLAWPADYEREAPIDTVPTPAIRLLDPVMIHYNDGPRPVIKAGAFTSIEIPLSYKKYTIERTA